MGDIRERWEDLVDPARLELRIAENAALISYVEMLTGTTLSWQRLRQVMERVNAQMDLMTEARDLIAAARPCPVTLRDQISAYQTNWHRGTPAGLELATAYRDEVRQRVRGCGVGHSDGRCSFSLPEPLAQGELRPLRDPNDSAERVFDLIAASA